MTTTTTVSRVPDIARQIRSAIAPVAVADADTKTASDALQEASNAAQSSRCGVLVTLAGLSQAGQWSAGEVDQAAAQAVASVGNAKLAKSVATFIGQAKQAMAPKVRAHVAYLNDLVRGAWEAEKAAEEGPKPLRKAFARHYHTFRAAIGACEEAGHPFANAGALLAFAAEHDPDLDDKRVLGRLNTIRKTLQGFADDFPLDAFHDIDDFLAGITAETLKAARDAAIQAREAELASIPLAPIPDTVEERIAAAEAEDMMGADEVDPIDAALGDIALAA